MLDDAAGRRSGIVDKDVDAPERGMGLLDEALRVRRLGEVSRNGNNLARRAQIATSTPSWASVRVTALPIPALAPVTTAFFPCKPKSMAYPFVTRR